MVTKINAWKVVVNESGIEGGGMPDYYLVEARLKVVGGCSSARRMEGVRNVLEVSDLNKSERMGIPGELV